MQKNKIFNPSGNDSIEKRQIINGDITGLFNLNSVKYPWAKKMYQVMIGNFWVPEKVGGLNEDAIMYKKLTLHDQRAYKGTLGFLIFLDSLQTVNVPNFSNFITSSEVNLLLTIQAFQEAIHSQSYTTILETVVDDKEREEIYYFWRDDQILLARNQYIGQLYQQFINDPNEEHFFQALVANYLLEGLYFYNGFALLDTLVYNGKMIATGRMINYIRRDELTHITLFSNILKEIQKEFPQIFDKEVIVRMFKEAVQQEIAWTRHIIGENIAGISYQSIDQYTKFLANDRLGLLKLPPLYPEITENPYRHLTLMANNNLEKTNFFESTVTNYTQSSSLKGSWDF